MNGQNPANVAWSHSFQNICLQTRSTPTATKTQIYVYTRHTWGSSSKGSIWNMMFNIHYKLNKKSQTNLKSSKKRLKDAKKILQKSKEIHTITKCFNEQPCPGCTWLINRLPDGQNSTEAFIIHVFRASLFYMEPSLDSRALRKQINFSKVRSPK